MLRQYLFTIFNVLVLGAIAWTQPTNSFIKNGVLPAPNAAALGKYTDIPVSYHTGVPNISVPIHTVSSGPLSVPIGLSYHSSGIKIAETASWVGLGWALDAGGMVTRQVVGKEDDQGYYLGYNAGLETTFSGLSVNYATTYLSCAGDNGCSIIESAQSTAATSIENGAIDAEPDVFSFNFAGYGGKFVFDKFQNAVLIPQQDLKIEVGTTTGSVFSRFTITTPDGTRYHFGSTPGGTENNTEQTNLSTSSPNGYKTSWFLTRIESHDGKFQINFQYATEVTTYRQPGSCTYSDNVALSSANTAYDCSGGTDDGFHYYQQMDASGKRLTGITSSTGTETVTFVANTLRDDVGSAKRLDEIQISTGQTPNLFQKKIVFSYDYITDGTGIAQAERKRLRLTQVQEMSQDGVTNVVPPYVFTYNGNTLPSRLARAIDHWGFHNGATGNESQITLNIPPTTYQRNGISTIYGNANRESNETAMLQGMLTKITYPTGGFAEFTFEGNRITKYASSAPSRTYLAGTPIQNCTSTSTALCCSAQSFSPTASFTAPQLSTGKMGMKLYPLSPTPGSTGCVLPYTNASITVNVYNNTTNAFITSRGFNLTRTATTAMPVVDSLILPLSDLNLQSGVTYRFTVSLINGRGVLYFFTETANPNTPVDRIVGGLRIKQIRLNDGIATSNDVYKSYKYVSEVSASESSGVMIFEPKYGGIVQTGQSTSFIAYASSITPLGDFNGYHVTYKRVVEEYNATGAALAKGKTVYEYTTNTFDLGMIIVGDQGPYSAPVAYSNTAGFQEATRAYDNSGYQASNSVSTRNPENYSFKAGLNLRVRKARVLQPSGSNLYIMFVTHYGIRTSPFSRLQSVTETRDGVSTTSNYTYDSQNRFLAPTLTAFTNSNGVVTNTKSTFVHDLATSPLRTKLLNLNLIGAPIKTVVYIGADTIDGTKMDYSLYDINGYPTTTDNASHYPYPWKHHRYEATFTNTGTIAAGAAWVLKGTLDRINIMNGLPWEFTVANWPKETYEWETNGLVKKRTYQNFVWQYSYFTNTRLVKSITNIDGQVVNYTYDQLQRLKTTSARAGNLVTTYDYAYRTSTYLYNTVKSTTALTAVSGSSLVSKATAQLLDGLGRPIEDIKIQHNPTKGQDGATSSATDVVNHYLYDTQGRMYGQSLPFVSSNTNGTYFAPPVGTKYTQSTFEASPLSRTLTVTPPDWYAITSAYGTNAASEVLIPGSSSTYFAAGTLYKTTVTDPDNRVSISYTDKKGRLILKRQTDTGNTSPADTYYQYDNKDRVIRVMPPSVAAATTDLVFAYQYDARDRMTRKKVPDMGSISMRYNLRDQLVFVQDSMQLGQARCLGTTYDAYGRPSQSGFVAGFPANADAAFTFSEVLSKTWYDGFDGSTQLSLTTNPQYQGKVRKSETKILDASNTWLYNVIDYDTHGRSTAINGNNHLNPTVTNAEALSMSYDWADNALAETRTHTPGAAGATGAFSIQNTYTYDHAGRRTNFLTTIGGIGQHIAEYNYNHRDELVEKNLHANQVASVWGWLQSVDFSYNAQGWLSSINGWSTSATVNTPALCTPAMPNPASPARTFYNDANDLFYMDIRYDQPFTGISGLTAAPAQKAGNISQIASRVRGREAQIMSYSYDYLSRLSSSTFHNYSDAGVISGTNNYNENLTYDLRGNIQTLQRTGFYTNGSTCTYGQIDNLTYSYTANTNRLHKVLDGTLTAGDAKSRGFNGLLSTVDNSMTYDRNGNLNKNLHKNVSTITYNHLNLPTVITFTTGNTIEFLYDAAGTKLRKTVKVAATVQYIQDYLPGGIEYRQTGTGVKRVESVFHAEGRYYNTNVDVSSTLAWRKEYNMKDHLGNTRLVFTDRNANGVVDITGTASTSDVLQENHYYAFGLAFEGAWLQNDVTARDNAYQYNGKELNSDFGLGWNDYGARWYDAGIGRFTTSDRFAEKYFPFTPYGYAVNNPVRYVDINGDSIDVFAPNGSHLYTVKDGKKEATGLYFQNQSTDKNGNTTYSNSIEFSYNDADLDRSEALRGKYKFQVVSDSDISKAMKKSGVDNTSENKWDYAYRQSRPSKGGSKSREGKMDFWGTYNLYEIQGDVLYITTSALSGTICYNGMDYGNYLWGQAMRRLGFTEDIVTNGAHFNNAFFGRGDNNYEWQLLDAAADQRAIKSGYHHFNVQKKQLYNLPTHFY
ncbi:RHS repeat-associated core domain-containing protein [Haliscomenobacter sp.]|uniref:RHS repeat domain-containing protein n=1 Tax=Haliscomenobacter sp. TaxID=2717303 RepID=UPI003364F50F